MSYNIALNFEDGVTRFIDCGENEKVLDAAFRNRINLPMDCSDGVCGTCKCKAEGGKYEMGDDYIDDALTQDELENGLVLTCQMIPKSDCAISIPATSTSCKTGSSKFEAEIVKITALGDAAYTLDLKSENAPAFLAGQYVNINVPSANCERSYSFSSLPAAKELSFLIKKVPSGVMSSWLEAAANDANVIGQKLELTGPIGSFYLRQVSRPLLFLAGGTGLAPFLSMLRVIKSQGIEQKIHLIYGVTRDEDLVLVDELQAFADEMSNFTFTTCVADEASKHERRGYVTNHMPEDFLGGDFDAYLCGPPPMVDAVQKYFAEKSIKPANFYYEKFTPKA